MNINNVKKSNFEKWVDENEPTDWYDKLFEQAERIADLEEVLKDARRVCHKAGLELMRDDIDEVLKGGDV